LTNIPPPNPKDAYIRVYASIDDTNVELSVKNTLLTFVLLATLVVSSSLSSYVSKFCLTVKAMKIIIDAAIEFNIKAFQIFED